MRELWPHQIQALEALRQSIGQGIRRIILAAPTGSGKTLLSAAIVEGARKKNNRVAFIVPQIGIVDQTVESFYAEGIRDIGVVQADHQLTDWSKPVQVCSIQTILSRGAFPAAHIVIIDEAHLLFAAHKAWITHPDWQRIPFIGLTATPGTKGLGKYFETMITAATTHEMIEKGFLSKYKVFGTGHPNLSGVKIVAGEYHEGQLSEAMQSGNLTADIIETWQKRWGKDKTFVFAVDCQHAQALQARFLAAGISCAYQDARTPNIERAEIKRKFHCGEVRVVANVNTLSIGVDWDVRCLVLARPTRSEMRHVQTVGRALRIADGKDHAIILDHSDTTARLGFVDDIYFDRLHDGKEKKKIARKAPLPRPCPKCDCMLPRKIGVCQNCGHKIELVSGITESDGELVEVSAGERWMRKESRKFSMEEKRKFYAMLLGHGIVRGFKKGWSAQKYKAKFGVWPNHMDDVQPMAPDLVMSAWIKSQMIRWAQSKKQHEKRGNGNALTPREENIIADVGKKFTPLMTDDDEKALINER